MAKQSGLGDNFYIGGYDLSGDLSSIDQASGGPALIDVTGIKSLGNERIGALRSADLQFTSFWNSTVTVNTPSVPSTTVPVTSTYAFAVLVTVIGGTVSNVTINGSTVGTGDGTYVLPAFGTITLTYSAAPTWSWIAVGTEHTALSSLPRLDTIASYFRGTTLLNPTYCVNGLQVNYDPTRDNTGNLTLKVEVQSDKYGGEWGKMITAGLRADTSATTGSSVDDNGAGSTFGGQAYFQLVEFVGTSITIDIQSATSSGGSYTSTGLTTSAMSAVGSQRLATTNTATINRFLKVVTTGTFTLATFAVAFTRNGAAGQVF